VAATGKVKTTVEEYEMRLAVAMQEFIKHYVHLRRVTRHTLGSHWFLWNEFAMFNGIDIFLKSLEPKVFEEERGSELDLAKLDEKFTRLVQQSPGDPTENYQLLQRHLISAMNGEK
jgi:hypothetical protein